MRFVKLLLIAAVLVGGYQWRNKHAADNTSSTSASSTISDTVNTNGFIPVKMPDGAAPNTVLILAPPNCPSDEARRAEALAIELTRQGIPIAQSGRMSFAMNNPSDEERAGVDRAVEIFQKGAPAVFVNGMGMSNPTPTQAAAEYQRTRI